MSDIVVSIHSLSKSYKRSRFLRPISSRGVSDVNLEIHRGEIFGLLGLNGSGKTTTLKLLVGMLRPTCGDVRVFGEPVPSLAALRKLGFLPELPAFYRTLTPREILRMCYALSVSRDIEGAEQVEQVLRKVNMARMQNKPLRELSKGMVQRIGVAQAIVHDPELLVLDEPVTGLDPLGIRQSRELLLELNHQGKTIFFSSHSISELEQLSHRIGILVEGRLVRLLRRQEWQSKRGGLEDIFMKTLEDHNAMAAPSS